MTLFKRVKIYQKTLYKRIKNIKLVLMLQLCSYIALLIKTSLTNTYVQLGSSGS